MWLWLLLTIGFFSFSSGKFNYYCLPALPAAAGLIGIHLSRWIDATKKKSSLASGTGSLRSSGSSPEIDVLFGWLFIAALYVIAVAAAVILPQVCGSNIQSWMWTPATLAIGATVAAVAMLKSDREKVFATVAATILAFTVAFSHEVLSVIVGKATVLEYLRELQNEHRPFRIAMHKSFAHEIDWLEHAYFFLGKMPDWPENDAQLSSFLTNKELSFAVLPENIYNELPDSIRKSTRVIEKRPYVSDKLTIDFVLKHHGHLNGPVPLLLISNEPPVQPISTAR